MSENTLPRMHIQPEFGWLNDPNGMVHHRGEWHVFYQFNPNAPVHETIHWGHASSPDLVRWKQHPVAFGPTPGGPDSAGCWSGVFFPWLERPAVAYSGVTARTAPSTICVREALDDDLEQWSEPYVVAGTPPEIAAMRDPFCFDWHGRHLAIVGAQLDEVTPAVLLYDVGDPRAWHYLGVWLQRGDTDLEQPYADMWECPQLIVDGDRAALVVSGLSQSGPGPVFAFVGDLTDDAGLPSFRPDAVQLVDESTSFYAPQVATSSDGDLMFGWVTQWDAAAAAATGVCGCLTLPRRVSVHGDRLYSVVDSGLQAYADSAPRTIVQLEHGGSTGLPRCARTQGTADRIKLHGAASEVEIDCPGGIFEVWTDGEVAEVFPAESVPRTLRQTGTESWLLVAVGPLSVEIAELAPPGDATPLQETYADHSEASSA
ncbi:glycoside hydrolase family 32 protein [Flexivirga caeni]|nr:glycoside hydrolase family 32 protein [Flexivirga caeni]